jgi:nicotinate-nucleotide adenylyltransferase
VKALFGGSFDPVHEGHLLVAREAVRQFNLDGVIFLPSGHPPHKPLRAPFAHRVEMIRRACPDCEISEIENTVERSFTYNTLSHFPEPRAFLIGADAFSEIRTWYRWRDVIRMTEFLVVSRPGHDYEVPEGARVRRLDSVAAYVSSSAIRQALLVDERPAELPQAVYDYIRSKGLYQKCATLQSSSC